MGRKMVIVGVLVIWGTLTVWCVVALADTRSRLDELEHRHYSFVTNVSNFIQAEYKLQSSVLSRQRKLELVIFSSDELHTVTERLTAFNTAHAPASLAETTAAKAAYRKSLGGEE